MPISAFRLHVSQHEQPRHQFKVQGLTSNAISAFTKALTNLLAHARTDVQSALSLVQPERTCDLPEWEPEIGHRRLNPGQDAADWQVSHASKCVRRCIAIACCVLAFTFDSDDCLGAKWLRSCAILCCSTSDNVYLVCELLRSHTIYQLTLAQYRSSCTLQRVSRPKLLLVSSGLST